VTLPQARAPDLPSPPFAALPANACDSHVHLVGSDFALSDARVEDPAPGDLDHWLGAYRAHLARLGCTRGVIVHSILYGGDNAVTLAAVRHMGDQFRAICLVRDGASAQQIAALAKAGTKGVRLNYVHGGLLTWEGAKALAPKLADHGMHIEMLTHAHEHLEALAPKIAALPVPVVLDHCAWPDLSDGVDTPGIDALVRLLAEGQAWVKLSALYRFAPEGWHQRALIERLAAANPQRILWGSDWPHLMLNGAALPDAGIQLGHVLGALPDPDVRKALFTDNPARLYGFQG